MGSWTLTNRMLRGSHAVLTEEIINIRIGHFYEPPLHPQTRHHPRVELTISDAGARGRDEIATSEMVLAASLEVLIFFSSAFLKSGILPRVAEMMERGAECGLTDITVSICRRVFLFPQKGEKGGFLAFIL